MRTENENHLSNIIDCFSGGDGGVKFALFNRALNQLDYQAVNGDKKADEILMIMVRFSKLISVLADTNNIIIGDNVKTNENTSRG